MTPHPSFHRSSPLLLSALALLVACAGTAADGDPSAVTPRGDDTGGTDTGDASPADWCAAWHDAWTNDGHAVVVCDEAWPDAPRVSLPPGGRLVALGSDQVFRDADGVAHGELGDADAEREQHRHGFALYTVETDADGAVVGYAPRLLVPERLMLEPWLSAPLEGAVGARIPNEEGDDTWSQEPSLPVRLEVASVETTPDPALAAGVLRTTIRYRIANLDHPVTAADGRCLPSLRSHGAADAFAGVRNVEVVAERHPSMHAFGDDEFVLGFVLDGASGGSMMGSSWYRGPSIAWDTPDEPGAFQGGAHGSPGAIPTLSLERVEGGGEPCE